MRCIVTILGKDRLTRTIEVAAESLFHADDQGIRQWSMFWWYPADGTIEVSAGERKWTVSSGGGAGMAVSLQSLTGTGKRHLDRESL